MILAVTHDSDVKSYLYYRNYDEDYASVKKHCLLCYSDTVVNIFF